MPRRSKPLSDAAKAFYAGFQTPARTATIRAGDRVRIVGDHPHAGNSGTWTGEVINPLGLGVDMLLIDLDDKEYASACYAEAKYLAIERRKP